MSLKQKTIRSAKWSAISTIVVVLFGFLQITLLSRIIPPHQFGILTIIIAITLLAETLSDFGISNSIIQQKDIDDQQLSTLYWINVLFGIFVFISFYFSATQIAVWLGIVELKPLIQIIAFAFLVIPHGQQYRALLQKELKFDIVGKIESSSYLLGFIVSIILAFYLKNAMCAVIGYLFNVISRTFLLILKGNCYPRPRLTLHFFSVKENLRFGAYLTADSIVNYINSNMSTALITKLLGATATGGYNIAYNVAVNPPSKINPILTRVLFPAFSQIQNDLQKLRINFFKLLSIVGFLNFPALVGLCLVASDFVYVLFGQNWMFIVSAMQLLSLAGLLRAIGNPIGSLLMAKARVDLSFKFNVVKIFMFAPALYFGAKYAAVTGVAVGFLSVQTLNTILTYFVLIRPVLGKCYLEYISSIISPFLHVVPMIMVISFLNEVLTLDNKLFSLFIKILIGVLVYGITILVSKNTLLAEVKSAFLKRSK
ncbi:MOP flippase family protein [Klebsiella variicola]|uniref:MOP flippase family protein n=1 Tax=Klebsiella variicola TaxID=244366 RepID=UPI000BA0DF17|nr:MOP flippase family protein [Klebsiella variicola]OZQ46312.1 colanic acid exporter [Klebsiella variicola]